MALSRVQQAKQLHLIDFDEASIRVSPRVQDMYDEEESTAQCEPEDNNESDENKAHEGTVSDTATQLLRSAFFPHGGGSDTAHGNITPDHTAMYYSHCCTLLRMLDRCNNDIQQLQRLYMSDLGSISVEVPKTTFVMPSVTSPVRSNFVEDRFMSSHVGGVPDHLRNLVFPASASGDGNCLYYSIAILLTGQSVLAWKLKFCAAVEILMNPERYELFAISGCDLFAETPGIMTELRRTLTTQWARITQLAALSNVIGRDIDTWSTPIPEGADLMQFASRYAPMVTPMVAQQLTPLIILNHSDTHFIPLVPECNCEAVVFGQTLRPYLCQVYTINERL